MEQEGTEALRFSGAPGNRDLYPDYGKGEGQPSNEEHSRPTLNIVSISRTGGREREGKSGKGAKGEVVQRWYLTGGSRSCW